MFLPPAAGQAPPASWPNPAARQLKRQWQAEEEQQQSGYTGEQPAWDQAAAAQPDGASKRRRVSGDGAGAGLALLTPDQPAQLQALHPQQQMQGCVQHPPPPPPQQQQPEAEMEMEEAGEHAGSGGSSDGGEEQVPGRARRRPRTGEPEYRLMLPTPLPPAIPQLAGAVPAWSPHLHGQLASPDAWALVPYAPSLAQQAQEGPPAEASSLTRLQHSQVSRVLCTRSSDPCPAALSPPTHAAPLPLPAPCPLRSSSRC